MASDPETAREEVFDYFTSNFIDLPKPCALRYQGKITPDPLTGYWGRLSMQTVMSEQSAFVLTDEPDESPREFETSGLIYFQVFAPIVERDAFIYGERLATKARNLFRCSGTPSGVWFRNARAVPLPFRSGDKEYRWNVVVEFEYNELTDRKEQ